MNRKGQDSMDKLDRRSWSMSLGSTLGMIAFSSMLRDEGFLQASEVDEVGSGSTSLAGEELRDGERAAAHFPVKAKRCIFLMME